MSDSLAQRAYNFFIGRGYTPAQSAGIVGNLQGESNLKINAVGDGGKAFGLAQWHPDRQANFFKVFNKSIRNASFEEQLSFVDWELRNTERSAGKALLATGSVAEAVKVFMQKFERPANMSSYNKRLDAANKVAGNGSASGGFNPLDIFGSGGIGLGDFIGNPATGEGANFSFNPFGAFDSALVSRLVAVIIGVIFVALAIAAFVFLSDGKKSVINLAKAAT